MIRWAAMLLVPSLALMGVGFGPPLVPTACTQGQNTVLHGLLAALTIVSVVITALAWRDHARVLHERPSSEPTDADEGSALQRRHFEYTLGAWLGTLFCLVLLAQWVAPLVLSPCSR